MSIILHCDDLATALDFYTQQLEFRVDVIFPADAPRVVELSGHGASVRLEQNKGGRSDSSPRGDEDDWGEGRAGMQYRDLIPGRVGGRFIASQIRIQNGGPVPDYVHHHHVQLQMIYCYRGWVRVVYEDQGPPIVMHPGDCVLQPPHIRHRVLECSDNMEVVEVSSPAEHETRVDHDMELPTGAVHPERSFDGQRFVFHEIGKATWLPGPFAGFTARDIGIAKATAGLASVQVLRAAGKPQETEIGYDDFSFLFVLQGTTALQRAREKQQSLAAGTAFVLQSGEQASLADYSDDLELLRVTTPLKHQIEH